MAKEDYYADAVPSQAEAPKAEPEEEEMSDSATAELPKAVLGGKEFKPGEEVVLKIVKVMEDSVLVKYATEGEEEDGEGNRERYRGGEEMSSMSEGTGNPGMGAGNQGMAGGY